MTKPNIKNRWEKIGLNNSNPLVLSSRILGEKMNRLLFVILLTVPSLAYAHPGGTDIFGCHAGSEPYHCHGSSSSSAGVIDASPTDVLFGVSWGLSAVGAMWNLPMLTHMDSSVDQSSAVAIHATGLSIALASQFFSSLAFGLSDGWPGHQIHFAALTSINAATAIVALVGLVVQASRGSARHRNRRPLQRYEYRAIYVSVTGAGLSLFGQF